MNWRDMRFERLAERLTDAVDDAERVTRGQVMETFTVDRLVWRERLAKHLDVDLRDANGQLLVDGLLERMEPLFVMGDKLLRVLDAVREHQSSGTVPVGAVMAPIYISDGQPSEADIRRAQEIWAQIQTDGDAWGVRWESGNVTEVATEEVARLVAANHHDAPQLVRLVAGGIDWEDVSMDDAKGVQT